MWESWNDVFRKTLGPVRFFGFVPEFASVRERVVAAVGKGFMSTKEKDFTLRTMTFLAALRHDRVDAPWLLDGPINGESFRTYVEKILVPRAKKS